MILVTGGTGLVGAHLLLQLTINGDKVRALYRNEKNLLKTKNLFDLYEKSDLFDLIEWVPGDINNIPSLEIAFNGITKVYHCAAVISFDPNDEKMLRKINIEGTANIVNFCLSNCIQKLCHVSSTAALGDLSESENIKTEETEWNPEKPHSDYAISKYGAEMEVWRGQQEGLDIVIVNPGVIIGPGFNDQGSGKLFKKVEEGLSFYTTGTTGFIAITDVIFAMNELMESSIRNERFILISQNVVYRDILYTIADTIQAKRPRYEATPLLLEIGWRINWFLAKSLKIKNSLTKITARSSYTTTMFSNEKIKKAINMEFKDIHTYIKEMPK